MGQYHMTKMHYRRSAFHYWKQRTTYTKLSEYPAISLSTFIAYMIYISRIKNRSRSTRRSRSRRRYCPPSRPCRLRRNYRCRSYEASAATTRKRCCLHF